MANSKSQKSTPSSNAGWSSVWQHDIVQHGVNLTVLTTLLLLAQALQEIVFNSIIYNLFLGFYLRIEEF